MEVAEYLTGFWQQTFEVNQANMAEIHGHQQPVRYEGSHLVVERHPIEDMITCPICFEIKRNPKLLACHHSFCEQCILGLKENHDRGNNIKCPLCRYVTSGLLDLQSDFNFSRLMEGCCNNNDLRPRRPTKKSKKLSGIIYIIYPVLFMLLSYLCSCLQESHIWLCPFPTSNHPTTVGMREVTHQQTTSNNLDSHHQNISRTCTWDILQNGRMNVTLISRVLPEIRVQKLSNVSMELANKTKDEQLIGNFIAERSQQSLYPFLFTMKDNTVVGKLVHGGIVYMQLHKDMLLRIVLSERTEVQQYCMNDSSPITWDCNY